MPSAHARGPYVFHFIACFHLSGQSINQSLDTQIHHISSRINHLAYLSVNVSRIPPCRNSFAQSNNRPSHPISGLPSIRPTSHDATRASRLGKKRQGIHREEGAWAGSSTPVYNEIRSTPPRKRSGQIGEITRVRRRATGLKRWSHRACCLP